MNSENTFIIAAAVTLSVLFVCITFGTMNGNKHYYEAMDKCVSVGATWIPTQNVGVCININGVTIHE